MTTKPMSHIFREADQASSKEEKIAILRKNLTKPMLDTILATYDNRVKWNLPPGIPPYKPCKEDESLIAGNYYSKTRQLYMFVELDGEPAPASRPGRKELAFVQILESIHPDDAKMLLDMKDRKWLGNTLSPELIMEAFPNMIVPMTTSKTEESKVETKIEPTPVKRGRGRPKKAA